MANTGIQLKPVKVWIIQSKSENPVNKRILIVDDDLEILELLKLTISIWCPDCTVITVTNGFEALAQLETSNEVKPFDLILTDYEMPLMNGLDLAREVHQNWSDIRVVMMTSQIELMTQQSGNNDYEIDGYIHKPFTLKQIKDILQSKPTILH